MLPDCSTDGFPGFVQGHPSAMPPLTALNRDFRTQLTASLTEQAVSADVMKISPAFRSPVCSILMRQELHCEEFYSVRRDTSTGRN